MLDLFLQGKAREIVLRDYQAQAIEDLREGVRRGLRRQVLVAPTGAGKTICASHLLHEADRKGSYSLFMVDRVSLVDQTSAILESYGIQHGVVQADHPRWEPRLNVQVCSIQTLARRSLPRTPDLVVWDEAHIRAAAIKKYLDSLPECVKIGLTATPFTKGMGNDWDRSVNVRTTRSLIEDGHLIEPTIYVARSPDDDSMERNSFGEFTDRSAEAAGIKIVGDVVAEWVKKTREHFGGPVKTIVFAATVDHGRELCDAFAAEGYNFQQISYRDRDDDERRAKIAEFRRPDSLIDGLVSCGVLTRGFDVTDVQCGISCRPYRKSLSSHIQEIGRVMRPHGEDKRALWLCHSGNIERFALDMFDVWDNGAGDLDHSTTRDSKARERTPTEREKVVCPECSGALRGIVCLACGWERPARSDVLEVAGELHEFSQAAAIEARDGLRAACLKDPRSVWDAALVYCKDRSRRDDSSARRWAYGVWRGIYPTAKLPFGWFDAAQRPPREDALALVDREVKRFRKQKRRAA